MKQKQKYIDEFRGELIRAGLYEVKNERLIKTAGMNDWMIAVMEEELRKSTGMLRQIGSEGQTKVMQHPHIESIRKLNAQNAYIYAVLGLGNRDDVEVKRETDLDRFINELQEN